VSTTTPNGGWRSRFVVVPGQHRPKPLRNGLIGLGILAVLLWCGYTKNIPFLNDGGQTLKAVFPSADNIIPGSQVRVHGVDVGLVKHVDRGPGGRGALITMKLKGDNKVTVHNDARAGVYWRTLLGGNFYVDLDPGSPSAPKMANGGTIPLSRTTSQVEFDQLLTSFNGDARSGLKSFFREFDKGFSDPDAPGAAIDALPSAAKSVAGGVPSLRGTRPGDDLPTLARQGSRALGALSRSENDLAGLIDNAHTALSVTAARREDIGSMLQQAPATMTQARQTFARLRTTFDKLDPISDGVRPGVRAIPATLRQATPAMNQLKAVLPIAQPVLRDINPALRSLQRAANTGLPLMQKFDPTLQRTNDKLIPWLDKRDSGTKLKNAWAIGPFFNALADSSKTFDVNGHVQNFQTLNTSADALGFLPCHFTLFDKVQPEQEQAACKAIGDGIQAILGGPTGQRSAKAATRGKK
jgi:ABC-type transporter Mla subunit MlaD